MYYNSVQGQSNSIKVIFGNSANTYTFDGKLNSRNNLPTLSFTPYELKGFTQERPWDPKEGEWIAIEIRKNIWQIAQFQRMSPGGNFVTNQELHYSNAKPLTDFTQQNEKL